MFSIAYPALGGSSRNVGILFPKDGEQSSGNKRNIFLTSGTDPGEGAGRRVGTPFPSMNAGSSKGRPGRSGVSLWRPDSSRTPTGGSTSPCWRLSSGTLSHWGRDRTGENRTLNQAMKIAIPSDDVQGRTLRSDLRDHDHAFCQAGASLALLKTIRA